MQRRFKEMVTLFLFLGLATPCAWAYRLPVNSDNDALPDEIEQWLIDFNAPGDDAGNPISPIIDNVYNDSDNDSIPDIIETNVTRTVVGDNDLNAKDCPGDGTLNYSGQRGFRVYTEGGAGTQNLNLQYLSHLNFCHLGNNSILVYQPNMGYNDVAKSSLSAHPTLADTYLLDVVWTLNNQTVAELTANLAGPVPDFITNISGNFAITDAGTTTNIAFASSGHNATLALQNIGGVVGLQSKLIDTTNSLGTTVPGARNPGSRTAYIEVNPGGGGATASVGFYVENGDVLPGYYVPSVGGLFIISSRIQADQTHNHVTLRSIFLRDRSGSNGQPNGSDFRGQLDILHFNATATSILDRQYENFYARHGESGGKGATELQAHTIARPGRTFTRFNLINVPFVADQISLTGPGSLNHTLVDVTDSTNDYVARIRLRNRVPGFVDNPAVGVSGSDNSRGAMSISQLRYQPAAQDSTQILPSGTYTATKTVTGDSAASETFSVNYTPATLSLSVVDNVSFNGLAWASDTPISAVGTARDQIITFTHTDQANNQRYLLSLQRTDGMDLNDFNANRLFFVSTTTSITIPQGSLDPSASYCARIQAKHISDGNLRSETDLLCFNTVSGSSPGQGTSVPTPIDFSGTWNFNEKVTQASGFCASDMGTTSQYSVDVSQNGNSFTANYNGTMLNGTITGNQIDLSGSVPDSGGTSTFTLTGTVVNNCFSGTSNWSWTDGSNNCSGGVSEIMAAPQTAPNACTTGNPSQTPSPGGGGGGGGSSNWLWLLLLPIVILHRLQANRKSRHS